MDWKDKMRKGMKLIKEACQENEGWSSCSKCPFDIFCTGLMEKNLIDPFEGVNWNSGEE